MEVCTLASSSAGNAALVSHGAAHLLIDAGISLRRIRDSLRTFGLTPDEIQGVLVTHAHSDHIGGIEMLVKYHKTPLFASRGTCEEISRALPEAEPYLNCVGAGVEIDLSGIAVESFRTMHDAAESVGYILKTGASRLAYATDLGCVTEEVIKAVKGADMAVIEANHDIKMLKNGKYPRFLQRRVLSDSGHLSNDESGKLARTLAHSGTRYIILAHLSRENNTPRLARNTVEAALRESGLEAGADITLCTAPPDRMSARFAF